MTGPAAALLLAALAAPAARASPAEVVLTTACTPANLWQLETSLTSVLRNFLYSQTGPRAAETSGYFAQHPNAHLRIGFPPEQQARFPDRPTAKDSFMSFDPSSPPDKPEFVLSHFFLHTSGANEADLIADRERQRLLMESVADVFVHEARHAQNKGRLDVRLPGVETPTFLEDETTAWYSGYLFLLETLETDPTYDRLVEALPLFKRFARLQRAGRMQEARAVLRENPWLTSNRWDKVLMLSKLARGDAEFEAKVRELYPQRPSVDDAAAVRREAARARDDAAEFERSAIALDEIADGRRAADPEDRRQAAALRAEGQRLIEHLQGMEKYLETPEDVAQARDVFHTSLAVLRAEADDRRRKDAALLKDFDYRDPDEDAAGAAKKRRRSRR